MKELVIFYSHSGTTKEFAQQLAADREAEILEVRDEKKPGRIGAFFLCLAARRMKKTPALSIMADMNMYDKITIMAPIWFGFPAPAINNVLDSLPAGKEVEIRVVSTSGKSSCREKVEEKVRSRGCTVAAFEDVKKE